MIIEIHQFEEMQKKLKEHELAMTRKAIEVYRKEEKEGKLKKLHSLPNLMRKEG